MDFFNIMGKVSEAKSRIEKTKAEVEKRTFTETVNGVTATVNGKRHLIELKIDESAKADAARLPELIMEAVNSALEEAEMTYKTEIKKATEGLIPNIPGFDLGSLL